MPRDRNGLLAIEHASLAPYAVRSDGPGAVRLYPESIHPFRTEFQRDRDRVLHSRAFRRLEYKTQVFLSGSGDHLRNRLTHTIEVAAIARTIALALGLNADLAEAVSLAHDLGHTPFGHAGERAMNSIMEGRGGFDHNLQALRVVDHLEIKYPEYNGINLTLDTRRALVKHRSPGMMLDGAELPPGLSLEAQTAGLADDITYYGHDVEDGLDAGILTPAMLDSLAVWRRACDLARQHQYLPDDDRFVPFAIRCLIDMMVGDAIRTSDRAIAEVAPDSPEQVEKIASPLVRFSPEFQHITDELRDFLYRNLYFGKELNKLNELSRSRLSFLFDFYVAHPDEMGTSARCRIEADGIYRAAADNIAGMTDNFAVSEYLRLS